MDVIDINNSERGYGMMIVTIFMAMIGLTITASLTHSGMTIRTMHETKSRTINYYSAEEAVNQAVSWLRQNSQKTATPFRRDNFYASFDRVAPAMGGNELSNKKVPALLTMEGTTNSVILSNDTAVATGLFPATTDITTGVNFNAQTAFNTAFTGQTSTRITLIDAIPTDPASDYGELGGPPDTDFYPVYRIDATTAGDSSSQVFATVVGKVAHLFDYGIYGEDYLELRQSCDSFRSSDGAYSTAIRRAGCTVGSNSTSSVHKNEEVYGFD